MWNHETEEMGINVRDAICGIVVGTCLKGVFIELASGEEAFAYFGYLQPGTEVLCTVRRKGCEDRRMLVSIDSVIGSMAAAA